MLIDLSVTLNEKTPIYPGDPQTKISTGGILERDGYSDHYVCVGTHVGTHMDAPSHMLKDGKNLDTFPLEHFSGEGVYIKTGKEFDLERIKGTSIREGSIVLFHTGMSDLYHTPEYFSTYPAIPEEIAQYLVAKKVRIVGVDMCSPDHSPFPIHKILLQNNTLIIENLTNLAALAGKKFKVYAFPIKLPLDGAPVRVVAETI